jgi:hypothetical protein
MAFNVNDFKSKVNELGVLKTSSVHVQIFPTQGFGLNTFGQFNKVYNDIQFSAEATNIPGVSLATTEIRRHGYGVIEKKPYVPIFTDINMVFRSDSKGELYQFFQTWMKMIINFDGRHSINTVSGVLPSQAMYEVAYKTSYMSTVLINLSDNQGKEQLRIALTEAYPIFLGEIPLAWQAVNDYVKIPIKFTFKDWYMEDRAIINSDNLQDQYRPMQPYGPPVNYN